MNKAKLKMIFRASLIISIIGLLSSCSDTSMKSNNKSNLQVDKRSAVAEFEYGGYGDTNKAILYGSIFEYDTANKLRDTLQSLPNVSIKNEQTNDVVFTDKAGQFEVGFDKGVYSLLIMKEGYQSLRISNFVSDPDQVSHIKIVLQRGKDLTTSVLPKWSR